MTSLIIALGLIFILLAARVPVAAAVGLAAIAAGGLEMGWRFIPVSAQVMVDGVNSFVLIAAPFFMLAGEAMNKGGLTTRIFRLAGALVGHLPGGLGQVNIVASMLFAGMTGSAISDAVGLGSMEIKAMNERGYDRKLSAAITAASSIIGPMIPPSVPMVIYGSLAGASIGGLFLAGVVPGLLMGISLMIAVAFYARRGHCPKEPRASAGDLVRALADALPSLILPVIVVGGIYSGIFTPTEAAIVAATYAIALAFLYREMTVRDLGAILIRVTSTSGSLFLIVAATVLLGWVVTRSGVMIEAALWLGSAVESKWALMLIVTGICLVVGLFMEPVPALVLLVPILLPAVKVLQIDLLHFGIVMVLGVTIGLLTPPVGLILFIVAQIAEIRVDQMIRAIIPFLVPLIAVLVLLAIFPWLSLALPSFLYSL